MANPENLRILSQGFKVWNAWRASRELGDLKFNDVSLINWNLRFANLEDIEFYGADLGFADLFRASLCRVKLRRAQLNNARLFRASLRQADLVQIYAYHADFSRADLSRASLQGADLTLANFRDADLTSAVLFGANLDRTRLDNANLRGAIIGETRFTNVDLSVVENLEFTTHHAPSSIGIDTLYKSKGMIPDKFLRDAGVPEEIIEIAHAIRAGPPIQWHSCFISYSTKDDEFARRLYFRMREANMRVWFAPEDLKGGKKLHEQLFDAIQIHDHLLLVLSEHSIQSEWVMTEIRKAREQEKKEKRRKLFPIRLTDFATLRDWTCFDADTGKDLAVEVREYFTPDFSNWKAHDSFEAAFARLQKDLKEESTPKT